MIFVWLFVAIVVAGWKVILPALLAVSIMQEATIWARRLAQ